MTERPILFSAEMVRALRENRKTQTRRTRGLDKINENPDAWEAVTEIDGEFVFRKSTDSQPHAGYTRIRCPYGFAGDRLWTRETFALPYPGLIEGCTEEMRRPSLCFRADGPQEDYPTDRYDAHLRVCSAYAMESAIPEKDRADYLGHLECACVPNKFDVYNPAHIWALVHATPRQRCDAAIAMLEGR